MKKDKLDRRSKNLRRMVLDAFRSARRGHLGSALSIVEILRVLYDDVLLYRARNPKWKNRDRFILSKGHGCLALYAILADKSFFPKKELKKFCGDTALLGGHPEHDIPGVEVSTGSLGHGLSIGVGMALALRAKFSILPKSLFEKSFRHPDRPADWRRVEGSSTFRKLEDSSTSGRTVRCIPSLGMTTFQTNPKVFVLLGDGEINEGSVWEAALSAGKHKLGNLTVLVDCNKIQSYGKTAEICNLEPLADKWRSFGFAVKEVDGHDIKMLGKVLKNLPVEKDKPSAVICRTVKGRGIKYIENDPSWHHKRGVTDEEIGSLYKALEEY